MSKSDSIKLPALWWILCIFLCAFVNLSAEAEEVHAEASALLKWKGSLDKQSQDTLSSWKNGTSPCRTWKGITCDESLSVTIINLTFLGLKGRLQHLSFSSFTKLTYFDIRHNLFYGNIPSTIGNLSYLAALYLSNNSLTGPIPQEIGMLSNLQQLDLSNNGLLSGRIPSTIGNLSNLVFLHLHNNSLSGPIPDEIGHLYQLNVLQLNDNFLSGPIPPSSIGNLTKLNSLLMSTNSFSGPIPSSIGNLVNLMYIIFYQNNLSGHVPSILGNLTKLTHLTLYSNKFSGSLPPQLDNLTHLINFHLGGNDFIGHLPQQVCAGGLLQRFCSANNRFTGPIPRTLKNCSSLFRLRLDGNQFVGDISKDFGVYPKLNYIDLSGNQLYGQLSPKWGKCANLTGLKISNNKISGGIPAELGAATNLVELNVSSNHLTGQIPKELGKLISLAKLSLSHNEFFGSIPSEIGSLDHLEILDLEANNFSGSITKELGELQSLRVMNLKKNRFEGSIPSEFGELQVLEDLDLSENLLNGTIPTHLGDLTRLITLNLSHNILVGTIESIFDSMKSLTYVDISYNQLEGSLPNNPAFHDITLEALRNNKGLCGNVTVLNPCKKFNENLQNRRSRKVKLLLILFFSLGTLTLVVIVGISYISYSRKYRKERGENEVALTQDPYFIWSSGREIMYESVIEATNYFDDTYLIGKGGQGSVYKAELPTGQVFAVKKLHSMPNGEILNLNAFTNEVKALTEIKHRNVVKLYGFCSNAQFSFLLYEFLEGGSLDDILKSDRKALEVDWSKRVNIVQGVADALCHMHHGCTIPIIHRDISSKNVLLDEELQEARLIDFGTAKFLNRNSKTMTTFVGTFGYAAPEIAFVMEANEKCDVYSFGVLTLEIIMGMHPGELIISLTETPTTYDLPLKDLLDQRLPQVKKPVLEKLMLIAKVAFACLNKNPQLRPTMEQVSMNLVMPKFSLEDQFHAITIRQLLES